MLQVGYSSLHALRAWGSDMSMAQTLSLLNPWQRNFPLVSRPYVVMGQNLSMSEQAVLAQLQVNAQEGSLSRIGGIFGAKAGGAALLAAMQVPVDRLDEVAALVSSHPGVNHNYERENIYNLWFVVTASCEQTLVETLDFLEAKTGLSALRLRMRKPYRIDLGFDLQHQLATSRGQSNAQVPDHSLTIAAHDLPLAALVEEGLPLISKPFEQWAEQLHTTEGKVLEKLNEWLEQGVLRRFGCIVRHHEFGFDANAMTVFNVPDDRVDVCGQLLAERPEVTLAYQRERAPNWSYNLYCMVHGRDRATVLSQINDLTHACDLKDVPREILFSRRRFKQIGARRFRPVTEKELTHAHST